HFVPTPIPKGTRMARSIHQRILTTLLASPGSWTAGLLLAMGSAAMLVAQAPQRVLPHPTPAALEVLYVLPTSLQPEGAEGAAGTLVARIRETTRGATVAWIHRPWRWSPDPDSGLISATFQ